MEVDSSFSSSTSTLSPYSVHDDSSSFNASSISSASEIFPLHREDTLSVTDSNLDSSVDFTDDFPLRQSGLYDINLELSIELPRYEIFNKTDILRSTVYTICGDIFFKHGRWKVISSLVAYHMGRCMNPANCVWLSSKDNHVMHLGQMRIAGHTQTVSQLDLPLVHDVAIYSGKICSTNIQLRYTAEVFLSPAIAAAEGIYKSHGFKTDHDACYKEKHMTDIWAGHDKEKLRDYNHHVAWAAIYNSLEKYRETVYMQRKFLGDYGFPF